MNTINSQSDAMPGSPQDSRINESQAAVPAVLSATRPLYWSVQRELWENRSIYVAPLVVAAITVFAFLIATIGRSLSMPDLAQRRAVLEGPYNFASLLIMGTTFVVAVFYSLDTLHGERRDRSILFWKSLPVSDLTTVLSKAFIPIVVLPLLAFVVTVTMQVTMLLLSSLVLIGSGQSASMLWSHFFPMYLMLLYHLLAIHGLWYAPIYCWMLLVSAWARRATFLWATLPMLAIGILEKIAFSSSHFARMLQSRLMEAPGSDAFTMPGGLAMHPLTLLTMVDFLTSPRLWIGFAISAAFLAGAVRLRRSQGPI